MPTDTPPRSRIPAPTARATPAAASRLAPPGPTRTSVLRAQKSSGSLRPPPSPSPSKPRARTPVGTAPKKAPAAPPPVPESPATLDKAMSRLTMREQIAARRAAIKADTRKTGGGGAMGRQVAIDAEWAGGKGAKAMEEEEDLLGRPSVLVDITRAKTSGKLDLSFRSLPSLPYALFNLHLGIEPSFPPPPGPGEKGKDVPQPAFYECVDLVSLKARDNEIEEVQAEISYFASLKVADFNRNKLTSLPPTFSELQNLVDLSLANNLFTSPPPTISALTSLISLDISHNPLTSISGLPSSLRTLIASHCKLTSSSLSHLPSALITLDISFNPLGPSPRLSTFLESLRELKHLSAESCELDGGDFKGEGWWTTRLETLELGGVKKEAWEIEAERRVQGRRVVAEPEPDIEWEVPVRPARAGARTEKPSEPTPTSSGPSTLLDTYHSAPTQTLTLPPSRSRPPPPSHIPRATLPISLILRHPWSSTLKVLVLTSRDAEPVFELPSADAVLESVEELKMEGCGLGESVRVRVGEEEQEETLLPLLPRLFPSLNTLALSYNRLPTLLGLSDLLFPPALGGKPSKVHTLRVRGCGVENLDALVELVRDHPPETEQWVLREVDVGDNELTKLPPELGKLKLDVCLVEGNRFRIPARKVWEQGGTVGLLGWLRERS